jgi:hypothetical protein
VKKRATGWGRFEEANLLPNSLGKSKTDSFVHYSGETDLQRESK